MTKIVLTGLDTIAEALGCSKKTLYKWIREKEFPAFKMDRVWRAMPGEIQEWLKNQRSQHSLQSAREKAFQANYEYIKPSSSHRQNRPH